MKVKELIEELKTYNQEAEIEGIFNYKGYPLLNICFGGGDGCTVNNCSSVGLMFTYDNSET